MTRLGQIGRAGAAVLSLVFLAFFAVVNADTMVEQGVLDANWQLLVDLTLAGISAGGIYALAGIGLVITYKATGVFNFAYGALGAFIAYVLWQLVTVWGWPVFVAGPLTLLVIGPLFGAALERSVFRPLQRREASVAEQLVATVGVYVVVVGIAFAVWSPETRDPVRLFGSASLEWATPLTAGGQQVVLRMGQNQLAIIAMAIALSALIGGLFRFTTLGTRIRAVVDRRELAQLTRIDANQVSAIAWAIGTGLAGITGVLLAPATFGLDPVRLPLVVIETFAVAVIARLVSLPLAIGGGLFLGLATSYASNFRFGNIARLLGASPGFSENVSGALDPVLTSLAVFVLFGALMLNRHLDVVGEGGAGSFVARAMASARSSRRAARRTRLGVAAFLLALPLALDPGTFPFAHRMVGLAIVFLSIVAITGFSGHITLGQAGFAGLGAFFMARLHAGTMLGIPELPVVPAMFVAALFCVPVGFIAGYPALKRRGLFLGLTTLAVGLVLSRYVFQNFYFNAATLMDVERPSLFGLALDGDRAFYYFELVVLGVVIALTHNLRSGRLGRILSAMRDSETASRSIGLSLRRYKLFIFSVSAFMAGLGGALMTQAAGAFSQESYVAFISLLWFATVVVTGITSIYGALLGAAILTILEGYLALPGLSLFMIGLAAILTGKLPGGIVGLIQRSVTGQWAPAGLRRAYAAALRPPAVDRTSYELSPFALRALADARSGDGQRAAAGSAREEVER